MRADPAAKHLFPVALLVAIAACSAPPPAPPPRPVADLTASPRKTAEPVEPSDPEPVKVEPPAPAPETIADISLTFVIPTPAWRRHPGLGPPKEGITQVGFERDDLLDKDGNAVRPFCGITTEPVEPAARDIIKYSLAWRLRVPFHVDEVFSHQDGTIQLENAIGYRGTTSYGGKEHRLLIVHALFRDRGFVVVCDSTTSVYEQARPEIEAFLKSLRHTEAP
jgi:hypothetical protein